MNIIMKYLSKGFELYAKTFTFFLSVLFCLNVGADQGAIEKLAYSNGYKPSKRVIRAIEYASMKYKVSALELTAIGILETGLGRYTKTRLNANGTEDLGLFQINTVNKPYCIEYNLLSPEGSSLCAAKLLARIKRLHYSDSKAIGRYHSGTPKLKRLYFEKLSQVLVGAK